MFASNVCVKCKTEKFAQKKVAENMTEFVCVEWKWKKKLKRLRKVFVVTLRDNETQSTEVITAVSRNGWFYLS